MVKKCNHCLILYNNNYVAVILSIVLQLIIAITFITLLHSQFDSMLSNDLQFAYKSQTSMIQCVSSVIETVSYYIGHLGHTYMCTGIHSRKQ